MMRACKCRSGFYAPRGGENDSPRQKGETTIKKPLEEDLKTHRGAIRKKKNNEICDCLSMGGNGSEIDDGPAR